MVFFRRGRIFYRLIILVLVLSTSPNSTVNPSNHCLAPQSQEHPISEAILVTDAIWDAYQEYKRKISPITHRAKVRFENQDWKGVDQDAHERMQIDSQLMETLFDRINNILKEDLVNEKIWNEIKGIYMELAEAQYDVDIAESFYNSISRRIFGDGKVVFENIVGVTTLADLQRENGQKQVFKTYATQEIDSNLIKKIIEESGLNVSCENLNDHAAQAAKDVNYYLENIFLNERIDSVDILKPLFFRNKGCYIVGRIKKQGSIIPIVLALNYPEIETTGRDGKPTTVEGTKVAVDAVLMDEAVIRNIFGYTRSSFRVDVEAYREMIAFLSTIMPKKGLSALYSAIGFTVLAKSEMFNDLVNHLHEEEGVFYFPKKWTKGNVMIVCTLATYGYVLKIIKNKTKYIKARDITREGIMDKYKMVHHMDRTGRMLDAIEFRNLRLKKNLFKKELLDQILDQASEVAGEEGDEIILQHLYLQRKVTPLDVFFKTENDAIKLRNAVIEFGNCIRDLAATGIFPGDCEAKNFGITQTGRVVYYDYDHLEKISDTTFESAAPAESYNRIFEDEWGDPVSAPIMDPGFDSKGLKAKLGIPPSFMDLFEEIHGEIFTVEFWLQAQSDIRNGVMRPSYPYPPNYRLGYYSTFAAHLRPDEAFVRKLNGKVEDPLQFHLFGPLAPFSAAEREVEVAL